MDQSTSPPETPNNTNTTNPPPAPPIPNERYFTALSTRFYKDLCISRGVHRAPHPRPRDQTPCPCRPAATGPLSPEETASHSATLADARQVLRQHLGAQCNLDDEMMQFIIRAPTSDPAAARHHDTFRVTRRVRRRRLKRGQALREAPPLGSSALGYFEACKYDEDEDEDEDDDEDEDEELELEREVARGDLSDAARRPLPQSGYDEMLARLDKMNKQVAALRRR